MIPKPLIKIFKSAGVILAILSIIYTSIQIITYYNQNKNKLQASFQYYDLHQFSINSQRFDYINDFKKTVLELNKYLKAPIPTTEYHQADSISIKKFEKIKNIFFKGVSDEILRKDFVYLIKIKNVSDVEIENIRIDLSDSFSENQYQYSYIIRKLQDPYGVNEPDSINIVKGSKKVILLGTLLPNETKMVMTYGLEEYSTIKPRIIYPDGYINAYGTSTLFHTSKLDELLTNLVSSSHFLQILIGILTILGIIYLFKLSFKIGLFFLKK